MYLPRLLRPRTVASAHCDLPCGVYDPAQARIEAESIKAISEKYQASDDPEFRTRACSSRSSGPSWSSTTSGSCGPTTSRRRTSRSTPSCTALQRGHQAGRRRWREGRRWTRRSPTGSSGRSRRSRRSSGRPSRADRRGPGGAGHPVRRTAFQEDRMTSRTDLVEELMEPLSACATGGGLQGGPAARRARLRRRGAHRQRERRRSSRSRTSSSPSTTGTLPELGTAALRRPPEEIVLTGGPYELRRTVVSVRVNPGSPYRVGTDGDGLCGSSWTDGRSPTSGCRPCRPTTGTRSPTASR